MASYEQIKYCPNCQKNVSTAKYDRCTICGSRVQKKNWTVRFRYTDAYGVEHNMRLSRWGNDKSNSIFETKREAEEAYADFLSNIDKYIISTDIKELTFAQVVEQYLESKRPLIKESSLYDLRSKIYNRIVPFFIEDKVVDIKAINIIKWQSSIAEYGFKYKQDLFSMLKQIFNFVYKVYDIPNPTDKLDGFRNTETKKEMSVWSLDEFNRFIAAVDKFNYNTYFTFLYYTGCRKGEAQALTWNDIDMENLTVKINKTYSRKINKVSSTKTRSSNRTIGIPINLAKQLQEYKTWKETQGLYESVVFGGTQNYSDSSIGRYLSIKAEEANVKRIRQHDFRHSHASLLISEGVPIVAVSKRLGHANITETLNTYTHLLPNDNDILLNALNRVANYNTKS